MVDSKKGSWNMLDMPETSGGGQVEISRRLPVRVPTGTPEEVEALTTEWFDAAVLHGFITNDDEGRDTLAAWIEIGRTNPAKANGFTDWYNEARRGVEPWRSFNECLRGRLAAKE